MAFRDALGVALSGLGAGATEYGRLRLEDQEREREKKRQEDAMYNTLITSGFDPIDDALSAAPPPNRRRVQLRNFEQPFYAPEDPTSIKERLAKMERDRQTTALTGLDIGEGVTLTPQQAGAVAEGIPVSAFEAPSASGRASLIRAGVAERTARTKEEQTALNQLADRAIYAAMSQPDVDKSNIRNVINAAASVIRTSRDMSDFARLNGDDYDLEEALTRFQNRTRGMRSRPTTPLTPPAPGSPFARPAVGGTSPVPRGPLTQPDTTFDRWARSSGYIPAPKPR